MMLYEQKSIENIPLVYLKKKNWLIYAEQNN